MLLCYAYGATSQLTDSQDLQNQKLLITNMLPENLITECEQLSFPDNLWKEIDDEMPDPSTKDKLQGKTSGQLVYSIHQPTHILTGPAS